MGLLKTTVIIPCYNEETRLDVQAFLDFLKTYSGFQFLFVDDGSRDRTFELLKALCEKDPASLRVLKLERNKGKAEAVRQGFLYAIENLQAPYVAFWDADLATPLEALPDFLVMMEKRITTEVLLGSRIKILGSDIQRHVWRHYLGRVFATLASMVLRLGVYDTQCGAKMFRVNDALKSVVQKPFVSKWIFDVEIIARYLKLREGRSEGIREFPLPAWHDRPGSKLAPMDFFRAFFDLIRIHSANR